MFENMSVSEEMAKKFLQEREAHVNKEIETEKETLEKSPNSNIGQVYEDQTRVEEPKITSLGKARVVEEREARMNQMDKIKDNFSWKNIPLNNLPSQGLFYPEGTQISIRSALVQEIRNFSTIDETDLIDVDDKLNMIIDKCVRIIFQGQRVTFKELLELDRFYLVYSVREMTFKDGENKLQMNVTCHECGNTDIVDIKKDNFTFFNLPEKLMKFYNSDERAFTLTLKDSGEKVNIYLPTLGVTNFVKHYVRKRAQQNKNFDKAFLKVSPFLFSNWRKINDVSYDSLNEQSFGWSLKKMSVIIGVIDMLQKSINPEITHSCNSCSAEVKEPLSFQGGVKGLFLYTFNDSGSFLDDLV